MQCQSSLINDADIELVVLTSAGRGGGRVYSGGVQPALNTTAQYSWMLDGQYLADYPV